MSAKNTVELSSFAVEVASNSSAQDDSKLKLSCQPAAKAQIGVDARSNRLLATERRAAADALRVAVGTLATPTHEDYR